MLNLFRTFVGASSLLFIYFVWFSGNDDLTGHDTSDRHRRALELKKRDISTVGKILTPTGGEIWFNTNRIKISWLPDASADIPYMNIDLCNSADLDKFFVLSIASRLPVTSTSFEWTPPTNLPTSTSYVIRIWGPYRTPSGANYWQLPDSEPFTLSRFPVGIAAPSQSVMLGSLATIRFFASNVQIASESGLTISLVDSSSSDKSLQNGLLVASNLLTTGNSYEWLIPFGLPTSSTYKLAVSGVLRGTDQVVKDESVEFQIVPLVLEPRLVVTVSKVDPTVGETITITHQWRDTSGQIAAAPFSQWSLLLYATSPASPYFLNPLKLTSDQPTATTSVAWKVSRVPFGGSHVLYLVGHNVNVRISTARVALTIISDIQSEGLKVIYPTNAEQWSAGQRATVSWSVDQSKLVNIAYWTVDLLSKWNGVRVHSAIVCDNVIKTDLSCSWAVPSSLAASIKEYFIRVSGVYTDTSALLADKLGALVASSTELTVFNNAITVDENNSKNSKSTESSTSDGGMEPDVALLVSVAFVLLFC